MQPFDMVKTRMQLQVGPSTGLWAIFKQVYKEGSSWIVIMGVFMCLGYLDTDFSMWQVGYLDFTVAFCRRLLAWYARVHAARCLAAEYSPAVHNF